jgi:hypothetical protein
MTDVLIERRLEPALDPDGVRAQVELGQPCLTRHNVAWQQSYLAGDGQRMVCWFRGPDAESVRLALRGAGVEVETLWAVSVHDAPQLSPELLAGANVAVQRRFGEPVTLGEIQAIEDAGAWCLETHRVKFARTFFSLDRRRMICFYQAPDAESVRLAQRQAGMPVEAIWAFANVKPPQ